MTTVVAELEHMLSAGQAARELGVSTQYLAQLALSGRIEYVGTPLGRLFEVAEVERLRRQRESPEAA